MDKFLSHVTPATYTLLNSLGMPGLYANSDERCVQVAARLDAAELAVTRALIELDRARRLVQLAATG